MSQLSRKIPDQDFLIALNRLGGLAASEWGAGGLFGGEGHDLPTAAIGVVLPLEPHHALAETDEPAVRQGDALGVAPADSGARYFLLDGHLRWAVLRHRGGGRSVTQRGHAPEIPPISTAPKPPETVSQY